MVGIEITKANVDKAAGTFARDLRTAIDHIVAFKEWLDTKTVGDLEALGYTTSEANTMKSAYADARQLADLYLGATTLGAQKDFRTFMKQLYGLGNVPL
jgi:hypothetical protein